MDSLSIEKAMARKASRLARDEQMQNYVAACLDEQALAYLAEYFGCHEPAFDEKDKFDQMAAMRRDSFRAFYLTLRRWRKRYKKAKQ